MRLAQITRTDFCGLGTLSRTFHEFLGVERTLALSFRSHRQNEAWLVGDLRTTPDRQITREQAEWLVDGIDLVLTHESWYGPVVPMAARRATVRATKTVMYECQSFSSIADSLTDLAICPHELSLREAEVTQAFRNARKVQLPFPIDTGRIPFRPRERAKTFVHFAKEGDRDGTPAVLAAWRHVKSDARLIVYSETDARESVNHGQRIEYRQSCSPDYWTNYADGDVLLMPVRWAGYGCHHHNALAAGMPVMTTAFWPFCDGRLLPRAAGQIEPDLLARYESDGPGLLPPSSQALAIEPVAMRRHVVCRPILAFDSSPESIAAKVDSIFDTDIRAASDEGREWAEARSFDALRERWHAELAG